MSKAATKPPIYLVAHGKDDPRLISAESAPIGLLYVGQALVDAGYRVRVIYLHGPRDRGLEQAVAEERPLFVGFSNFVYPRLKRDVELSRLLRAQGIKVVWGGIFPTTLPNVTLGSDCVDYIVLGEGELVAPRLAEAIENGELPRGIPGVGYRDGEELTITPPDPPPPDLDRFRFGIDLIDFGRHIQSLPQMDLRVARVPFSRGCPFRCRFCYNSVNPNRQLWRSHSREYMKDLAERLTKRYRVNRLGLVCDNPFGAPKLAQERLSGLGLQLMSLAHISNVTPGWIDWARENRLVRVSFGLESGSDRVLHEVLGKTFNQETIVHGLELTHQARIETQSAWMGLILGETRDELRATIGRIDSIARAYPYHGFNFNLFYIYPETPMWELALAMGHQAPNNLDEWADYRPEAYPLLGYSHRRANRLLTTVMALYPLDRKLDRRFPGPVRAYFKRRLERGDFRLPVEETAWAGWQVVKAARRAKAALKRG